MSTYAGRGGALGERTDGNFAPLVAQTDGEVTAVQEQGHREQLVEEIRQAERARDLLKELERRLKDKSGGGPEHQLAQLDRLAQSLPEAHPVRLHVESAVGHARAHRPRKAGSGVSRSRSVTEGRISYLRGALSRLDAFSGMDA